MPIEIKVLHAGDEPLLANAVVHALLEAGLALGCRQAWVLTDRENAPAMGLYASCGGREGALDQVMFEFALSASASPVRT
jgi:hypothetical protein